MGKVSILMNCFNGEKYVREALQSIFDQTYKNFEVIFVDNCSMDSSAKIAAEFGEKVKIVRTPHNMSLCKARVFAKDYIDGDFFCVLDVDDLMMPTKLEKQVSVLKQNPQVGAVYCDTIYFKDSGEETSAYDGKIMPSGNIFSALLGSYFLSLETVMMRMSELKKHNLYFSEKYNVSSDMELFVKLAYYTEFYYIPEPLAKWRYGHVTESVSQYESFPKEYEQLLEDLKIMIPNFEQTYASQIHLLKGIILNMKGISAWQKGQAATSKQLFKEAVIYNKRYFVPYVLVFLLSYQTYKKIRLLFRKV